MGIYIVWPQEMTNIVHPIHPYCMRVLIPEVSYTPQWLLAVTDTRYKCKGSKGARVKSRVAAHVEGGESSIGKGQAEVNLEGILRRNCEGGKKIRFSYREGANYDYYYNYFTSRDNISSLRENVLQKLAQKLIQPPCSFLPGSVPDGRGGYRERKGREWYRNAAGRDGVKGPGERKRRGIGEGSEHARERERETEPWPRIDRPAENYPLAGDFAVCERPITYESSQWGALSRCSWAHADPSCSSRT